MKRITLYFVLASLLFGLAPAALLAQDDLVLESLVDKVADLMARMGAVEERVTALEGFPDTGFCSPSVKGYHPMTIAAVNKDNPGYQIELYPDISHVRLNSDTGEIIVQWQSCCTEIITEYYDSRCQWVGYELK